MKTYLDCLPCFLSQSLKTSRIATADEKIQREIMDQVMKKLIKLPLEASPPEIAQMVYRIIKEKTGDGDPYSAIKKKQNTLAMSFYPELKEMAEQVDDPLLFAIKLAIAGNIIDLGAPREIKDIRKEILDTVSSPLAVNDYAAFRDSAKKSRLLLYLGDNAGEIVFDRILVQELKKRYQTKIIFAVRDKPVINDATLEDARSVGMELHAELISNGSDAPATILSECSPAFMRIFQTADMIIAKGQGNYESLSNAPGNIFFLLMVKCPVLADDLKAEPGDSILKNNLQSGKNE